MCVRYTPEFWYSVFGTRETIFSAQHIYSLHIYTYIYKINYMRIHDIHDTHLHYSCRMWRINVADSMRACINYNDNNDHQSGTSFPLEKYTPPLNI